MIEHKRHTIKYKVELCTEGLILSKKERLHLIDQGRGFAVVIMVIYHMVYDIIEIFGLNFPLFFSPVVNMARDLVVCLFLILAGGSTNLSRNNLKRGLKVFGIAIGLSFASIIVGMPIMFGILHIMGICMILSVMLQPILIKVNPNILNPILIIVFILTFNVRKGYVGVGDLFTINIPESIYQYDWIYSIGFPNSSFISYDYFPMLPWAFMFMLGISLGRNWKTNPNPILKKSYLPTLSVIGSHTLIIYVAHQPILYVLIYGLSLIIN